MEDIVDVESELTQRLSGLQKRLEKVALPDLSSKGDLGKVHELIKANLQRSKVIQDQIKESKVNIASPPKCSRHSFGLFYLTIMLIFTFTFRHTRLSYSTTKVK